MRRPGRRARAAKRSPAEQRRGEPQPGTAPGRTQAQRPGKTQALPPPAGTFPPPTGQGAAESKDEASR